MKKLLFAFLLVISATAFAQTSSQKPLVLVDGMIASQHMLDQDKGNVVKANVYKSGTQLPAELSSYADVAKNGLVSVKVKENYYDKITLGKLNAQFNLDRNSPVLIDGNLIKNTETIAFGNILENMNVQTIDGQKMLVIDTTPKRN